MKTAFRNLLFASLVVIVAGSASAMEANTLENLRHCTSSYNNSIKMTNAGYYVSAGPECSGTISFRVTAHCDALPGSPQVHSYKWVIQNGSNSSTTTTQGTVWSGFCSDLWCGSNTVTVYARTGPGVWTQFAQRVATLDCFPE